MLQRKADNSSTFTDHEKNTGMIIVFRHEDSVEMGIPTSRWCRGTMMAASRTNTVLELKLDASEKKQTSSTPHHAASSLRSKARKVEPLVLRPNTSPDGRELN